MEKEFDLVVCLIERDLPLLETGLPYILRFLQPARILLLASGRCLALARSIETFSTCGCAVEFLNEDFVVPGLTLDAARTFLAEKGADPARAGWYFQQFLKLCYSMYPGADGHYLVWDADTIPLRRITFFGQDGKVMISVSAEHNELYFGAIRRLIGKIAPAPFSFISEHMMFDVDMTKELLRTICGEAEPSGLVVMKRILEAIDPVALSESGFSEFETYGNFILKYYPDSFSVRKLPSMRLGTYYFGRSPGPVELYAASTRYYWASFEAWEIGGTLVRLKKAARRALGGLWTLYVRKMRKKQIEEFVSGDKP